MPPFELTVEYRKTPEYRSMRDAVLTECPGMCDYMVDAAILMTKRYPDLLKRYRTATPVPAEPIPNTLEGSVFIE